jgi:hypothetical protein
MIFSCAIAVALLGQLAESYTYLASCKNLGAFAALKDTGSVVAWGNTGYGGDSSAVSSSLSSGVVGLYSTITAFAALKSDGSVVTWGDAGSGGSSTSVASQLASGVVAIFPSDSAFAALKNDGTVVVWGSQHLV